MTVATPVSREPPHVRGRRPAARSLLLVRRCAACAAVAAGGVSPAAPRPPAAALGRGGADDPGGGGVAGSPQRCGDLPPRAATLAGSLSESAAPDVVRASA